MYSVKQAGVDSNLTLPYGTETTKLAKKELKIITGANEIRSES